MQETGRVEQFTRFNYDPLTEWLKNNLFKSDIN